MDGASPKIRKIYMEESGREISLDHTTRRSTHENTSDLTWPDRATDVTPANDNRRATTRRITYDTDNWTDYDPYGEDLTEESSYHEERMQIRLAASGRFRPSSATF